MGILEETVTLIRPSANAQHKDEILKSIGDAGYTILRSIEITMNENQFDKLYSQHAEAEYYGNLKEEMLSGPSTILELQKEDAPDSLRAKFQVGDVNPIHAASNQSQVKLEADLFFENQDDVQKESAPAAEEPQAAPEVNAEEAPVEAEATEVPAEPEAPAEAPAAEPAAEPETAE